MDTQLYFSYSEALRLKKILNRFEAFLLHENESRLSIYVARKTLDCLSIYLGPASKTRELVRGLLAATKELPPSRYQTARALRSIKALRDLYKLNDPPPDPNPVSNALSTNEPAVSV